jgi:hypothetical protein
LLAGQQPVVKVAHQMVTKSLGLLPNQPDLFQLLKHATNALPIAWITAALNIVLPSWSTKNFAKKHEPKWALLQPLVAGHLVGVVLPKAGVSAVRFF